MSLFFILHGWILPGHTSCIPVSPTVDSVVQVLCSLISTIWLTYPLLKWNIILKYSTVIVLLSFLSSVSVYFIYMGTLYTMFTSYIWVYNPLGELTLLLFYNFFICLLLQFLT